MSDTDAPLKKYEVEVTGSFSTWVEVEAEDEDAAHDAAKEEVAGYGAMVDWQDDRIYEVVNITEMTTA